MSKKAAKQHRSSSSRLLQLLAVAGVLLLAVIILLMKQDSKVEPVATAQLPEEQLQHALAAGQPTLAFFHSLTCDSCKEMTAIVEQVYPEFTDSVALVDVDVYDQRNGRLLQSAGIRAIPTVILFDRAGQGQVHIGVLKASQLRRALIVLGGSQ